MELLSLPTQLGITMAAAESLSTKFGDLLRKYYEVKASNEQIALIRTLLAEDRIFELLDFFQEHSGVLESFQKTYPGYLERFPTLVYLLDFWNRNEQGQEILDNSEYQSVEGVDFSGLYIQRKILTDSVYRNCKFAGTEFDACYLYRLHFVNCDFTGAIFHQTDFCDIEFRDGNNSMRDVSFTGEGDIRNLQMLHTDCTGMNFKKFVSGWGTYYYEELTLSKGCMPLKQHQKFQALGTNFRHTPDPFYDIDAENDIE